MNAALRELLGLRGGVGMVLDETMQPVISIGSLSDAGPLSYAIPFYDFGDAAGNAAGNAGAILINPADSGVIATVEYIRARATSAGARVDMHVGTLNHDNPKPVFDLATATKNVNVSRIKRALATPRTEFLPLLIEAGAKTGPNFAGYQWTSMLSADLEQLIVSPPAYWVLPPDSWIGGRNNLAGAAAPCRISFAGRIWPLA
jgi:hypothetical protein